MARGGVEAAGHLTTWCLAESPGLGPGVRLREAGPGVSHMDLKGCSLSSSHHSSCLQAPASLSEAHWDLAGRLGTHMLAQSRPHPAWTGPWVLLSSHVRWAVPGQEGTPRPGERSRLPAFKRRLMGHGSRSPLPS